MKLLNLGIVKITTSSRLTSSDHLRHQVFRPLRLIYAIWSRPDIVPRPYFLPWKAQNGLHSSNLNIPILAISVFKELVPE